MPAQLSPVFTMDRSVTDSELASALASAHAGSSCAWDRFAGLRERAEPAGPSDLRLLATAGFIVTAHLTGRYEGIEACVDELMTARDPERAFAAADELLLLNGQLIGFLLFRPRDPHVDACASRLLELVDSGLDVNLTLAAARTLIYHFDSCGEREVVMRLHVSLQRRSDDAEATPYRVAEWLNLVRRSAHYGKDPRLAEQALERMRALARQHGLRYIDFLAALADLDTALPRGNIALARSAIERAESVSEAAQLRELLQLEFAKSRLARLRGQADSAVYHGTRAAKLASELRLPPIMRAVYVVNEAQSLLLNDEFEDARAAMLAELESLPEGYADEVRAMVTGIDAYLAVKEGAEGAVDRLAELFRHLRERRIYDLFEGFPEFGSRLCVFALERDIEVDFVRSLIAKCALLAPELAPVSWPWPIRIEALGGFAVYRDDVQLVTEGKSPRKPLMLLKAVIALGATREDRGVEIDRLIDLLWSDEDAADPKSSFEVALSRLRKWLGVEGGLKISDGRLSLNPRLIWCDVDRFERTCEALLRAAAPHGDATALPALITQLGSLYRGRLFGSAQLEPWSVLACETVSLRFSRAVRDAGMFLETRLRWADAIRLYEMSLVRDMLSEPIHRGVMRCYLTLGQRADAQRAFERCRAVLEAEFGLPPSPETLQLMEPGTEWIPRRSAAVNE
ncbi:BTAD domain-containing putative transcriptional regulator [Paucibacter sp. R3-3]|uniref:BTAD domain-containing putative transcriptional regulator n=1 Tax=Roseateles agri TaxID=3098619 RepID=A0ABU5DHK5_9BURK|nr:BTAD domain-containing putative transcriptional regulator [Paucibacter sp. R3-3]MDY0745766.1 BTAD domain-containing putative transcriptional regulator [Paucibacter sp. R3-3]